MVGTKSPSSGWLHQPQHPTNRVSSCVHDGCDFYSVCVKYSGPVLSLVSGPLHCCCIMEANGHPSGYDWQHGEPGQPNAGTCLSSVKSGQVLTYLGSFSGGFAETSITVSSSSSVSAIGLLGWNVATTTSGAPSQPTTSGSSNTTQASGGLSPGAKAGIGVSAAIGGIGIIALICAVFLLRRRPKVSEYAAAPPAEPEWRPVQPIHEMGTNQKTAELPVFR